MQLEKERQNLEEIKGVKGRRILDGEQLSEGDRNNKKKSTIFLNCSNKMVENK